MKCALINPVPWQELDKGTRQSNIRCGNIPRHERMSRRREEQRICRTRDRKEKCRFRERICPVTRLLCWNTPLLRRSAKICQLLPNYPVSLPSLPASPTSHRRLSSGSHRVRTASWKISLYRCTAQFSSFPSSAIPWCSSPWRETKECARWRTFICWTWWVFHLIPLIRARNAFVHLLNVTRQCPMSRFFIENERKAEIFLKDCSRWK